MKKKKLRIEPTFKEYNQHQGMLFPPSLDDMIPQGNLVRLVNSIIESMDISNLVKQYKMVGTSSYHPKMMLKAILYAYTQRIYSSRRIAKALRENIHFMWICGMNRPDFRTINRFRTSRLKATIDELFYSLIEILEEMQVIKLENYFLDGTKIEANANKYTWVWKKSNKRYRENLEKKVKALLVEIDRENEAEESEYKDKDLEETGEDANIDSEALKKRIEEMNERLREKPEDKDLKKAVKILEKDYLPKLEKYEDQAEKLGDRNSYSKTDTDATFMRMKEDQKNGQAKPGYNVQIGTENQFIVGYSIHQQAGDTSCFIPHLERVKTEFKNRLPENIITDAGYGSEENYEYIESNELGNYVKYNYYHIEKTKKFKENKFRVENLPYDSEKNEYSCPGEKKLKYSETREIITANGYKTHRDLYECEDCNECTFREQCHKSANNRRIQVSHRLNYLKGKARENLNSEKGTVLRKKRGVEVESVFGQIKHNKLFKRFLLRGIEKVNIEWGLISIAHNLMKIPV
ncbi:MAG: IS1182 family transposase [Spirochaetota bacterium]